MSEAKKAYPLQWPVGWRRIPAEQRKRAQFSKRETKYSTRTDGSSRSWSTKKYLSIADGVGRVLEALRAMDVSRDDVVISTNVPTRLDGLPRSDAKAPADPGAAVYFRTGVNEAPRCIAIDRYDYVEDNLAAIAATLEAMRAIELHGGAEILDRAFTGFAALPSSTSRDWWYVLQVNRECTKDAIDVNFKRLMKDRHPDAGGSHDAMAELNAAREQAYKAVSR